MLSGCSIGSFTNFGTEGLLFAPKLSKEQAQINDALINTVGSDITLIYPKTGDYRSSFVIENIDDEPTDEAIVFFQYNDSEKNNGAVMVEILDINKNGEWQSFYQFSGAGPEVEGIKIEQLSENSTPSVIIGFSTLNIDQKQFQIYNYTRGNLSTIYTDTYSILDTIDIDNSGFKDILKISNDANTGVSSATLLRSSKGEIIAIDNVELTSGSSSYVSSVIGKTADGSSAIFLDAVKDTSGNIQTEVVSYTKDKLQNPMVTFSKNDKLMQSTSRSSGYSSMDIDDDGVVEIPITSTMMGYENYLDTSSEKLLLTDWYVYKDSYSLVKKNTGYYNLADAFAFMYPEKWRGKVTVKIDNKTKETVFYQFNDNLARSKTEFLRINVIDLNDLNKYEKNGYENVKSNGMQCYVAKISNLDNKLAIDSKTVTKNIYLVD